MTKENEVIATSTYQVQIVVMPNMREAALRTQSVAAQGGPGGGGLIHIA